MRQEKTTRAAVTEGENRTVAFEERTASTLPPPSDLAKYEKIVPGFSERILTMTEKEQADENHARQSQIDNDHAVTILGQVLLALISVSFLGCAVFLGINGQTWPAVGMVMSPLGLVWLLRGR